MEQQDPILSAAVRSRITAAHPPVIQLYDSVTSTNDLAMQLAAERAVPAGTVIAAKRQTAGRGRQGRAFYSPQDTGLYLSMVLYPDETEVGLLTPMAAVAAAEAVEQCSGARVQIKWVNDLLLNDKKICGILILSECKTALFRHRHRHQSHGAGRRIPASAAGHRGRSLSAGCRHRCGIPLLRGSTDRCTAAGVCRTERAALSDRIQRAPLRTGTQDHSQ